ncbi:MAG: YeeE/YedE family protein [Methylomicrobium sp.]
MKRLMTALLSGTIFGFGLALSQMTNPDKVLGFLDIAGQWDPSLAFVMLGALTVAFGAFRFVFRLPHPLFDDRFHVAKKSEINKKLIGGALLFGIGWGMTGYCPGPAVSGLGLGNPEAFVMVVSIYLGFMAQRFFGNKS